MCFSPLFRQQRFASLFRSPASPRGGSSQSKPFRNPDQSFDTIRFSSPNDRQKSWAVFPATEITSNGLGLRLCFVNVGWPLAPGAHSPVADAPGHGGLGLDERAGSGFGWGQRPGWGSRHSLGLMAEAGAPLVMASRCGCQRSWPALLPLRFRLCLPLPIWDEVPASGFGSGCEALLVG